MSDEALLARAPLPSREAASEPLLGLEPRRPERPPWWPSLVGLAVAVALAWAGHRWAAALVGGLVIARALLGLTAPGLLRAFESALTRAIGGVFAYVLLTPLWLLVIVPLGLTTRRRRRMFEGAPSWQPYVDEDPEHSRWS
jgi:hypothetical protein